MSTAALKREIAGSLDRRHAEQIAFLAELVRVPSDNPPGDCAPHADRTAALLSGHGFAVERHPVPEELVRQNGMRSAVNLVVRECFGDGPTVALNTHGDAVPPGDGWTVNPYGAEIRNGVMYGRGVAVSKCDFATYAYALLALKAIGVPLAGSVELHLTYDEEVSGHIGPRWLLEQGISRPNFAITAGFTYMVITAHNGCLQLEVRVRGRSAHAAYSHAGHDALEATTAVLRALYEHRRRYGEVRSTIEGIDSPTLVVGTIGGGISTNVVPDSIVFRLDRRLIPEEQAAVVVEPELVGLMTQAAASFPGISLEWRRVVLADSLRPVPGVDRLIELLTRNATDVVGERIERRGVPLFTDARHYAAAGVPTVMYGAGPRSLLETNVHRADERLRLEDLRLATRVVAFSLLDLLAG